jgi:hypothetical protein
MHLECPCKLPFDDPPLKEADQEDHRKGNGKGRGSHVAEGDFMKAGEERDSDRNGATPLWS